VPDSASLLCIASELTGINRFLLVTHIAFWYNFLDYALTPISAVVPDTTSAGAAGRRRGRMKNKEVYFAWQSFQ
jgi:hypothetical protein